MLSSSFLLVDFFSFLGSTITRGGRVSGSGSAAISVGFNLPITYRSSINFQEALASL
jgi:hypothetical protein